MRKTISVLMVSLIITLLLSFGASAEALPEMQVEINAKSACLMDADSAEILMAKNIDDRVYPASVTKIMSLLLVCEALDEGKIMLDSIVTVSENASEKGGSQIWLKQNEQMSVGDLIKATAVASANDACTALGELVAGSDEAFVSLMNKRARELGMTNTHFENCTGLDDTTDNHYTTARDVAVMSRELLKHKRILSYTTIWTDTLRGGKTELTNTNKLVRFYQGATGLKTGTTSKAGCCVSATAERDGLRLIAVVMGSDNSNDRFTAARKMLDWGFANYGSVLLKPDMSNVTGVKVINGFEEKLNPVCVEEKRFLIKKGEQGDIQQSIELPVDLAAPVEKGQIIGYIVFKLNGEEIERYKLISEKRIDEIGIIEKYRRIIKNIL